MLQIYWITITAVCIGLAGVSGDKIIDGEEAKPHSRPYMAFLMIKRDQKIYQCGGFLILPNFILTAAHCKGQSITALLGAHNHSKKEKSWQEIPVKEIIPHECFNNRTKVNDIMLLKLKHSAKIKHNVGTISIPKRGDPFSPYNCSVAGWGRTETNGKGSNVLREVKVNVNVHILSISQIFLRGTGMKGDCEGDSGGPLVCQDNLNKPTAVGIVSYGSKRCEDPGSNVYTRVSAYRDWIEMKINASSSA
ncbi:mast cell protease 1A-like [Erpetoichthys calabaricus]|uniref:trypsin n=1 Tax=Erpetoichthys calabaricus TaxID=27687 RepID=A0A8C4T7K5_ERPCA|nr:mast cell protease 1A-like [Erpetoichthys calabaricus]